MFSVQEVDTYTKFKLQEGNLYMNNQRVGIEEFYGGKNIDICNHMFRLNDDLDISGSVTIEETLSVNESVDISNNLNVNGDTTLKDVSVQNMDLSGNLRVNGDLVVDGTFNFSTQLDVSNQGTGPALKVSQFGVGDDQDVALFNAGLEGDALKIDSCGNSHFYKHVNVSGTMTSNSPWALLGETIDGDSDDGESGYSVSINAKGDIVAIGAPSNGKTDNNSTKIYQYTNGTWKQLGETIYGDSGNDQSGFSVSINAKGDIVAIGAPFDDNNGEIILGSTKMYQYTNGTWVQFGQTIYGDSVIDFSGFSVSINAKGDIVAIGASYDDENYNNDSGSTKMYQYTDSSWVQLGEPIYGDSGDVESGYSVSINAKGDIVAIGARYDENGGINSGSTKMYQYTNGLWNQLGETIYSDSGDVESGYSVSINAKGDIVAIGAPLDENGGINSGSTKIYQKGLRGNVTIEDDLSVGGDLFVNGGIYTDNFSVADTTGHTTIGGDLSVGGDIRIINPINSGFSWTMSLGIVSGSYYFFRFTLQKTDGTPDKFFEIRSDGTTYLNFTGQHRCFIKDLPFSNTEVYAGRIVCADQNTNISMSGSIKKGNKAITQNETLPYVSLSTKNKDKSCFGVISDSEDPNERVDKYGGFCTPFEKEKGDTRVYINSVGEGAIWVSNKDGPLESGDYITTCGLLGYGAKQADDILHNYSVAKITMDCDFNPRYVPRPTILKDASGENILDPYEQIQWTDEVDASGNVVYEYEYNIRYINSDAQIITYEEYMDNSNNSYIIAYVGCTYHCG